MRRKDLETGEKMQSALIQEIQMGYHHGGFANL